MARCIAHKRDLVEQDEFDTGSRQLLNLGHTIGHGASRPAPAISWPTARPWPSA